MCFSMINLSHVYDDYITIIHKGFKYTYFNSCTRFEGEKS